MRRGEDALRAPLLREEPFGDIACPERPMLVAFIVALRLHFACPPPSPFGDAGSGLAFAHAEGNPAFRRCPPEACAAFGGYRIGGVCVKR